MKALSAIKELQSRPADGFGSPKQLSPDEIVGLVRVAWMNAFEAGRKVEAIAALSDSLTDELVMQIAAALFDASEIPEAIRGQRG